MANEKASELLKDKDFLAELWKTASAKDAQKLFADKGADISIDELMALRARIKQKSGAELTDDELAAASGGGGITGLIEGFVIEPVGDSESSFRFFISW